MKRIFWGLVKIAFVVVLIVWISRGFFSETSTGKELLPEISIDVPTEGPSTEFVAESEKENPLLVRLDEPVTEQQRRYVEYSVKAGTPVSFSGKLNVQGTEPLSSQLARSLGEPVGEWTNLSIHKKTFWVLSELVLRNINVDSVGSVRGAIIEIQNGEISIDISDVSKASFSGTTPTASSFVSPVLNSGQMDIPVPAKKTTRRMSARSWEKVLEAGTR